MNARPRWLPSREIVELAPEILDGLVEAVTIRDPEDHIVYANRAALARMHFSSLEELQHRSPEAIFADYVVTDEEGRDLTMADIPSVRLLGGQEAGRLTIRTVHRLTGALSFAVLKSTLLRGEDGRPLATVTIIEDVTAEKLAELRERYLTRVTDTLMSSLDYEETLRNVARLAVPEIADWCAVDLLDERGERQQVVVAHADPEKVALAERLRTFEPATPPEQRGVFRVAQTGVPELYADVPEELLVSTAVSAEHLRLLRQVGLRSAVLVPMKARGRTLGVMTLVNAESMRRFDEDDLEFAGQIAARAAIAVDNARLATSRREIAITLQRSLLPEAVPEIDGWDIGTMYRAASASDEVEVGGDFYDFIQTPAGWFVLLGDVTGRGVEAASMTSLLRYGARFLVRDEHSPAAILGRLDEALRELPGLSLCTALCVRLGGGEVVISSAGHPMPLIVSDGGGVRELADSGPLLGGWAGSHWWDSTLHLAPEETLFMYTDGVTDARGERGRFGLDRLERLLSQAAGGSPHELLAALEAALDAFQIAGQSDDTGAVALRPAAVERRDAVSGAGGAGLQSS